jgi:hypothetical protein
MSATPECSTHDIAAARTWHDEIKEVLKAHERGEQDNAMLQDIKVLCICIIHTIRDPYCQQKICDVAIQSEELFAIDKRSRQGHSSTQPVPVFRRLLILESLEAFDDRLRALETTRQPDHGASGTNVSSPDRLVGDSSSLGRSRAAPDLATT